MATGKYVLTKEFRLLEKRIDALEEQLGLAILINVETVLSLHEVYGDDIAELLINGDYVSVTSVKLASDENLLAVNGIGPVTVKRIREIG